MAHIKLVLSTQDTIGSSILRWAQRCKYSHCEVLFNDFIIGSRLDGVKRYKIESLNKTKDYEISHIECTQEQFNSFKNFIESQVGKGYDWRAYVGFVFFKKEHDPKKWFCSELILEGLNRAGIEVFRNVETYFCMPRDFHISPLVKETSERV